MEDAVPAAQLFFLTEVYVWSDLQFEAQLPNDSIKVISVYDEKSEDNSLDEDPAVVELTQEMTALGLPSSFSSTSRHMNLAKSTRKRSSKVGFRTRVSQQRATDVSESKENQLHDNDEISLASFLGEERPQETNGGQETEMEQVLGFEFLRQWVKVPDATSPQGYYFWNVSTNETTWDAPMCLEDSLFEWWRGCLSKDVLASPIGADAVNVVLQELLDDCSKDGMILNVATPMPIVASGAITRDEGDLILKENVMPSNCDVEVTTKDEDGKPWEGNLELCTPRSGVSFTCTEVVVDKGRNCDQIEKFPSTGITESSFKGLRRGSKLSKYWNSRYQLFSKFDQGIWVDVEGLYSVTPEAIARHQASRCKRGTIVDGFAGVGGNAIQFALMGNHVTAIDIDEQKIRFARHNAAIYGVEQHIEFIVGDFFELAPSLKADMVFLSPPWGGPAYKNVESYDIKTMLLPKDGDTLFRAALTISSNIVMFLPRNVSSVQLEELSYIVDPPVRCEAEKNFLNGRLKGVTVYYGDFAGQEEQ